MLWITPKLRSCTPATKPGWGAAMTKTLGSAAHQLYAGVAAMFLPIENQPGLIADIDSDPFVGHTLSSATCAALLEYTMEETKQENQETAEEPVQSPPVKRVTKKVQDPKKLAAGRAGAAARKTKQEERLLEQFQVAKEPFRPATTPPPHPPPPSTRLPIFLLLRRRTKRFPSRNAAKD